MLTSVGVSVLSGACTTLGASVFMLAAKIVFFFQFGLFMFCTIGLSIVYALVVFTTLLALMGPEGKRGSLLPLFAAIKGMFHKKGENEVMCEACNGRGYRALELSNTARVNTAVEGDTVPLQQSRRRDARAANIDARIGPHSPTIRVYKKFAPLVTYTSPV